MRRYQLPPLDLLEAFEAAARTMASNMMDDAALEGVQAFVDKRPPRWRKEE